MIKLILVCCVASLLFGCATQNVSQFSNPKPSQICIAKHDAVKDSFLEAMQEGFTKNNATTKVIQGTYVKKNNMYHPTINKNDLSSCDAIAFYVANWTWDLAMYMSFANIWITDIDMTKKIAQATYQAGGGLDKFISAREKTLELVDQMYGVEPKNDKNTSL